MRRLRSRLAWLAILLIAAMPLAPASGHPGAGLGPASPRCAARAEPGALPGHDHPGETGGCSRQADSSCCSAYGCAVVVPFGRQLGAATSVDRDRVRPTSSGAAGLGIAPPRRPPRLPA